MWSYTLSFRNFRSSVITGDCGKLTAEAAGCEDEESVTNLTGRRQTVSVRQTRVNRLARPISTSAEGSGIGVKVISNLGRTDASARAPNSEEYHPICNSVPDPAPSISFTSLMTTPALTPVIHWSTSAGGRSNSYKAFLASLLLAPTIVSNAGNPRYQTRLYQESCHRLSKNPRMHRLRRPTSYPKLARSGGRLFAIMFSTEPLWVMIRGMIEVGKFLVGTHSRVTRRAFVRASFGLPLALGSLPLADSQAAGRRKAKSVVLLIIIIIYHSQRNLPAFTGPASFENRLDFCS